MGGDNLEEYYRARAAEYEQIYYRDDPACQTELSREAKKLTRLVEGKKVLELACGSGYWTRIMSRTAASILASDIAPEMLAEAKKKAFGCEVSLLKSDMFDHSFGDGCFDIVALGFWFSHQPRQAYDQLFDLLVRPLKKNGLIWMIDNNPQAEAPLPTFSKTDAHGNNYKQRTLRNGETYLILKNYFDLLELKAIFSSRFDIPSLRCHTYYWSAVLKQKDGKP